MVPPLIGLTAGFVHKEQAGIRGSLFDAVSACALPMAYVVCVEMAGGMPVILAPSGGVPPGEWVARLDGLLLTGGVDLDPATYGEEPLPALGRIDAERDAFELALTRAALAADLPLLAICRGMQVLNVAAGGSLVQDIPGQVKGALKHAQDAPRWHASHNVSLVPGSKTAAMLGTTHLRVNSFHHQAVKDVARGFVAAAEADDGIIEAIESQNHAFAVGVQWHPEELCARDPVFLGLFRGLVEVARAPRTH